MGSWKRYKDKWKDCKGCELCETRYKTVLARGKIPCDILFIGEAPGISENVIGKPFVGEAGSYLNNMIDASIDKNKRLAFTNMIACIPLDENGEKVKAPHKEHMKACEKRLIEFINLAKPKCVVLVGQLAEKHAPSVLKQAKFKGEIETIIHPAAILRTDITQKGLLAQQTVVRLSNLEV